MTEATAILITLIVYKVVLIAIGLAVSKRTRSASDFFLGGRKLGPWVAALSASASSSSVWTLLGVSGFAYKFGVSSLWLRLRRWVRPQLVRRRPKASALGRRA